jgi:hypothetical protein
MRLSELTADQRRHMINATQIHDAWREASRDFRHTYRGSMHWRTVGGRKYLYRVTAQPGQQQLGQSLGPQSPETEKIKAEYIEQRTRLKRRASSLDKRLGAMATLNRAMGLGRIPTVAAKVLRGLDREGLLGSHVFVVGTHALYAYEAASGVLFDQKLLATGDVDLLWDVRQRIKLAMVDVRAQGLLGVLRRVDRSFAMTKHNFRATNDQGFIVDLIRPMDPNEAPLLQAPRMAESDLEAVAITGLQWLLNAPRFEATAMGADGRPVWISSIDPRAFALHKYWIAKRGDREAMKRVRDSQQARAVAHVAATYLNLPFEARALTALPLKLIDLAKALIAESRAVVVRPPEE